MLAGSKFFIVCLALLAGFFACKKDDTAPKDAELTRNWELVFQENFSDYSFRQRWKLEGFAEEEIVKDNSADFLKITTKYSEINHDNKQSVLWCRERFTGDLRFEFRAKGGPGNRSIFYFNANPTSNSGFGSIFGWHRPDAQMLRYAGSDSIEMYSVGILRDNQELCNLRYIGGTTAPAYRDPIMHRHRQVLYGNETIFNSYHSPFLNKPDTWFEFKLQITGGEVAMEVNGVTVFDVRDPGNVGTEQFAWTPLTNGGWFAFRNFVPRTVCIDYVKVYRMK